ncbi:hypothetical protein [Devosia aurantiaca]|uniref:Uncharacterized protein n=1 Tax=Devosia aurantiaca TaxID=2714858 RepID=A0A6M1SNG9_9HYPH|nr:hypothetical protein [Devosia aurantiaca]NGP17042.1 hypothetical protein [Devosia aurantiaca]
MHKTVFLLLATLLPTMAATAQSPTQYLAQAVSTMQATNAKCGFGLSDEAILAGSARLGAQPADPAFVSAVAQQRQAFEANLAYLTPDCSPTSAAKAAPC